MNLLLNYNFQILDQNELEDIDVGSFTT